MNRNQFQNPILSGFYPDPSICRVGEDYYMVTSSFAYYPGLPIHHSRDLIHWEQIGHGIHRPQQLDYKECETSLGLWAPTIRYHEGTYYIINTFVSEGREAKRDNYIITAKNPAGPWSDPIFIEGADGIDSSLFFDDDGKVWYVGNFICKETLFEGHHGIYLCELDAETLQFKGKRSILWQGGQTRSKWLEAPHIYKRSEVYYLMVAEGGTFTNHSVMMAKSTSICGPYEICPRNPIISHRHLPLNSEISVTGHGDLVETQHGEWWMVILAVRPYEPVRAVEKAKENGNIYYNLGRETFLLPVAWADDGWLIAGSENGLVNTYERKPALAEFLFPMADSNDEFEDTQLKLMWNTIHAPKKQFYSLEERKGFLRLHLQEEVLHEICTPAFIGRRQQHNQFLVKTAMEFVTDKENEEAGLALIQDSCYHYCFVKTRMDGKSIIRLTKVENGVKEIIEEIEAEETERIYLSIQGNIGSYSFYYGYVENQALPCGSKQNAGILSSSVNNGFTGTYVGMYATSNHIYSENSTDYDWFHYIV